MKFCKDCKWIKMTFQNTCPTEPDYNRCRCNNSKSGKDVDAVSGKQTLRLCTSLRYGGVCKDGMLWEYKGNSASDRSRATID